jgi:uncharacterized protein
MQIWIDGDACPRTIKDIVFRMTIRTKISLIVVANHPIPTPISPFIKKILVGSGFDVVDKYIVANIQPGDLVITADIPFADDVVTKGGFALNPRGELYSANNIKQHLGARNFNETLRGSGQITGGPSKQSAKEVQKFANALDSWVAKNKT